MNVFKLDSNKSSSQKSWFNKSPSQKSSFSPLNVDTLVRLLIIWLVLVFGASSLIWRLYQLQIKEGDDLATQAKQQQTYNFRPYIPRRSVIDSRGSVVALDKVVYTVYVHPIMLLEDKNVVAEKIANILTDRDQNEILKLLNSKDSGVLLGKTITEDQGNKIKELNIEGIDLERRYARFYPQGELIADIIGYVDTDHAGQAGVEYSQEKLLERDLSTVQMTSFLKVKKDGQGAIIPASLPQGIVELDDLQLKLTLDLRLQRATRDALKNQIKKFNAKRGAVIVMDVHTGAIVALACEPTYNPNKYSLYDFSLYKNWSVTDSYEPGSTFKPVNVAIALDEGVINDQSIVLDAASTVIDGWPIANASKSGKGWVSVTKAMEVSSNTAMIHIIKKLNRSQYYKRLQELGIDRLMGLDLPFEATGYLKPKEIFTARDIEPAVSAFGQGLSLTPLKLVQLHAAIANGGKLVTPHVIEGLANTNGELESIPKLETKQLFSESSANSVLKMMESVVANGTGAAAQIDGYHIGGKTGTAQKHDGRGRYQANAKITSFISILPTNDPNYVILAVVDEPQGANTYGSTVAAPIVKEVMNAIIRIKGIPPSYPIGLKKDKKL
ncbi:penicillin-binding protein 2 [Geminocystis sp. NIES-3709]|uniref:peptidoglycan D,D-transpeptidase FtsI family protein n=1 Tax=Geminocystis sp. NIES-3709 TaxID=1617448 RepID=UPI0005FC3F1C|nr:penicillin-binding protein 2 [Geminocystis sp. NIES-3709]BAQ64725.1 cell division protein FtsI [Geminocystis sp. NIES-3709]